MQGNQLSPIARQALLTNWCANKENNPTPVNTINQEVSGSIQPKVQKHEGNPDWNKGLHSTYKQGKITTKTIN